MKLQVPDLARAASELEPAPAGCRDLLHKVYGRIPLPNRCFLVVLLLAVAALAVVLFINHRNASNSTQKPNTVPVPAALLAAITAQQPGKPAMLPPPRYRVIVRPAPPAPKPPQIEGFVRGHTLKLAVASLALAAGHAPSPATAPKHLPPKPAPPKTDPVKLAPLRVKQEAPALIATAPKPRPATAAPRETVVRADTVRNLDLGRQLLGADGKREGSVPLISMDYRATLGWAGYVSAMERLGGHFFVYDPIRDRVVANADVRSGQLTPVAAADLKHLSPRMREIQNEPAVVHVLQKAREQFALPEPSVILLLPLNMDFQIVGSLVRSLAGRHRELPIVARVAGSYERQGSGVQLRVTEVFDPSGQRKPENLLIALR